jgi:hypothetical protein
MTPWPSNCTTHFLNPRALSNGMLAQARAAPGPVVGAPGLLPSTHQSKTYTGKIGLAAEAFLASLACPRNRRLKMSWPHEGPRW